MLPNNHLQVLLDEDDDPHLEDHWLTDSELQVKKQMILSQTQPYRKRDQLNSSGQPSWKKDHLNSSGYPSPLTTHQGDHCRNPPASLDQPNLSAGDAQKSKPGEKNQSEAISMVENEMLEPPESDSPRNNEPLWEQSEEGQAEEANSKCHF